MIFRLYNYELYQNQIHTSIIREIWERYEDVNDPFESINYILVNNYNSNFPISWLDFCSRNIFNGIYQDMDNDFYYYIDQALIEPISTSPSPLTDFETFSIAIDNESAAIQSYQLGESGIIGIEHLSADYLGRFSIVSTSNNNDLFWGTDTSHLVIELNS